MSAYDIYDEDERFQVHLQTQEEAPYDEDRMFRTHEATRRAREGTDVPRYDPHDDVSSRFQVHLMSSLKTLCFLWFRMSSFRYYHCNK